MKPSKAAASLLVALCFLFLIVNCDRNRNNATKPESTNKPAAGATGDRSTAQRPGGQNSQQSGNQNAGSKDPADTNSAPQPTANPEGIGDNENPEPAPSGEDRSRKESSILGTLVDVWSRIIFPFGASLLLTAAVYFLFLLKRRMSDVERYLYDDLKPNISDIRNKRYADKTSQDKSAQGDSARQSDLSKLDADLADVKRIAQNVETALSGLKDEIRKGNALQQEANGGESLDKAFQTDSGSMKDNYSKVPAKEPFYLDELGQKVNQAGIVPFPIPTSVADCLRYLESEKVPTLEVKGEGLREGGVFVPASGGKFLLIASPGNARKDCFVIPKVSRFATIQDYTHYQKYYDCDDPSSGDVWIIRPALVVPDSERKEWRLVGKGRLEIRT